MGNLTLSLQCRLLARYKCSPIHDERAHGKQVELQSYAPAQSSSSHSRRQSHRSHGSSSHRSHSSSSHRSHSSSSHRSHGRSSHRTNGTDVSIDSIGTIQSLESIGELARMISRELYPQETLVAALKAWHASIDPLAYQREYPWQPEVENAYDHYKALGAELGVAHQAYERYFHQTS